MKEVTNIYATSVYVICPHCNKRVDGWLCNPAGCETTCDFCDKKFKIHKESDIEYGY